MNERKIDDRSLKSGERAVKNDLKQLTAYQLYRYITSYKYISPSDFVGDLGCGVGYGSYLLSKKAKKVIGYDDSQDAINYAKKYWKTNNVRYECKNIFDINTRFHVVTIFEVIEHVKNPNELFKKLADITRKYLIFTCPTPQQTQTNKFHWKHYSPKEIQSLLSSINFQLIRFDGIILPFYVSKRIK